MSEVNIDLDLYRADRFANGSSFVLDEEGVLVEWPVGELPAGLAFCLRGGSRGTQVEFLKKGVDAFPGVFDRETGRAMAHRSVGGDDCQGRNSLHAVVGIEHRLAAVPTNRATPTPLFFRCQLNGSSSRDRDVVATTGVRHRAESHILSVEAAISDIDALTTGPDLHASACSSKCGHSP